MALSCQSSIHKWHLKYQIVFTLAPNSTRFAKFCTDLATNISVLAAIGDGESIREVGTAKTLTPKGTFR